MSDIIHLLPDSVANQIAAGEVIQRPASVVKELVENSLDAGAENITIIITDAGKTAIQVVDDGKGMSETDARLSFERHATSKIRQANDLFALTTMGFRGEALASIAAVAQVVLRTRQKDEETGTEIRVEGSHIISQQTVLCDVGASFTVNNIFYNIPARRKFLKSNHTEMSNIMSEFERIALAHPEIGFRLSTPSEHILVLPSGNFRQRIINIFGKRLDKHILTVKVETPVVTINGFTGTPESSKKKGALQFFFVNGRFMRHPYFAKAVQSAYERLIPDGEAVPFFLSLKVDPSKIDVNIHPTKTEIKFEDEQTIWQILLASIREALGKYSAIPTIDFDTAGRPDIPLFDDDPSNVRPPQININPNFNPFGSDAPGRGTAHHGSNPLEPDYFSHPASQRGKATSAEPCREIPPTPSFSVPPTEGTAVQQATPLPAFADFDGLSPMASTPSEASDNLFGEQSPREVQAFDMLSANFLLYKGRYLITSVEEGLMLIDAPRAHMRILYEEYLSHDDHQQHFAPQRLLFPEIIDVPPSELPLFERMQDKLLHLGFELSPLGGGTFSILAIPGGLENEKPVEILQQMVSEAAQMPVDAKDEMAHRLALMLARRMAIPVGQALSTEEMRNLAHQLFCTSNPNFAPNGHRITVIIPHQSILTRFG